MSVAGRRPAHRSAAPGCAPRGPPRVGAAQPAPGHLARSVARVQPPGEPDTEAELAYFVADAFATYETKIGKRNVTFQLNVKNLFDKTYYPSSANRYFVAIGDARQVSLITTLEF